MAGLIEQHLDASRGSHAVSALAGRSEWAAAVVGENKRDVRYVQSGAVPVRSQNRLTCPFAGCFEPSTAHSEKAR
jgi:hypothetical protein